MPALGNIAYASLIDRLGGKETDKLLELPDGPVVAPDVAKQRQAMAVLDSVLAMEQ